ncbi:MAG: aminopeptidase P family protein [Paramuribaculum sp.]|nr:aminopeptidase P family protein [Paramuribaculum sp.]
MNHEIPARISSLRDQMRSRGISAVIIPQTDSHQSEYLADHWQVRRWLSGFTGSAGALVVTLDRAFVWADSRYWLQAAAQLEGTGIEVMEEGKPEVPDITSWLLANLAPGSVVGIDGMVFSDTATAELAGALASKDITLVVDFDVIDRMWTSRPPLPLDAIFLHDEKYAGESAASKIAKVMADVSSRGADSLFISDLAEIAWILNIRSRDVESNPVATAFLLITPAGATLFTAPGKLTAEVTEALAAAGVTTAPYDSVKTALAALPAEARVLVSPTQTAGALTAILGSRTVRGGSPVAMLKGCKNDIQIDGVRRAMERDGVALVKSFMEIEQALDTRRTLTELDIAEILTRHRSAQPLYFDQSFDTIAGFGPHGAIVHYSATPETSVTITPDNLLLIDSGANYLDGTTDITRTITLGQPTPQQRTDFTLVMKGHIALATAVFPEGTRGAQLDALARIFLWKHGLSYLHGTGHGVGHFLNVHEGPQSIRLNENPTPLTPGMITSDEPGVYRAGEYGIRCENLILTIPAMHTDFGRFYAFEVLTLFPFDLRLFDTSIMSDEEIAWVNDYHSTVRTRLSPALAPEEQAWLEEKTRPLTRS